LLIYLQHILSGRLMIQEYWMIFEAIL
jgi:hypothetical protein